MIDDYDDMPPDETAPEQEPPDREFYSETEPVPPADYGDLLPDAATAEQEPPDREFYSETEPVPPGDYDDLLPDRATAEQEPPDRELYSETEPVPSGETERLRQPRAQNFRRRLRTQIGMLPLALYLIALGGYLIARRQAIKGLPDFSSAALVVATILALALTIFFHALLFGRRERGLLFVGLWIGVTAGTGAVIIYRLDQHSTDWWPLLAAALGLAFFLTYLIERLHDSRLIFLSMLLAAAGGTGYWITTGHISQHNLDRIADYWPLLLSVVGVGLLPLVFRRRAG